MAKRVTKTSSVWGWLDWAFDKVLNWGPYLSGQGPTYSLRLLEKRRHCRRCGHKLGL
ncbi:MAG: hypothetical protein JSS50_02110 [Proteobacteria bacterium]|nr:hypothetical protein [Pseudomonadota bacterium]